FFGPEYIKELKGPFQDIELLACGGINPVNVRSFLKNGAGAVAFGGSIFKEEWLKANKFNEIEESIRALIEAANLQ
ncbi:MAG: 2-dehydro-3-deoxyphosphogluconate aldolase, partial [Candidatus Omnitrophica bacterium]|nr:2-dehydro-3-deoxyphosphogluconate aldolase [Candidatus Omnitrophota bacterium]